MPAFDVEDTIAAIASAHGSAMRGIIRISGPDCQSCLQQSFVGSENQDLAMIKSPTSITGAIRLVDGTELPGELLYWPTQRSYTRQPAAEFHTFGSPPLLKLALSTICQSAARLANPGEFTLRAFLSGRLDLTQAEAVLAIIDANGETELNAALKQLAGGLTGPLTNARDQLKYVLAELEAGLDFVEEDIEFISQSDLLGRLEKVGASLKEISDQITSRDLEPELIRVALIGLPNAGKSSLFNRMLGNTRAIVTPIAGTTTDFLSAPLEIGGQRIEIVDTAGMEDAFDTEDIPGQAQRHRIDIESTSHLKLLCIDATRALTDWELKRVAKPDPSTILVQTKSDLGIHPTNSALSERLDRSSRFVATSSVESSGIDQLQELIRVAATKLENTESEIVGSTVLRAAESLRSAAESVHLALQAATAQAGEEVVAAEIRQALDDLGLVVGTVYTDDILDVVFSRFCIGK